MSKSFDQLTDNGQDLSQYNDLLGQAVKSIVQTFKRRSLSQLQTGRGGLIPTRQQQVQDMSDFELVTWLVIK